MENITEEAMRYAFFDALLQGYAGQNPPTRIGNDLPSSKFTTFKKDNLIVVDCWQVTPLSDKSFGTTTISGPNGLLWMMQYWGRYPEFVIPFLQNALASAYEVGMFMGGRGPHWYSDEGLVYINTPSLESTFEEFSGMEYVFDKGGFLKGWHKYHGMKLWI